MAEEQTISVPATTPITDPPVPQKVWDRWYERDCRIRSGAPGEPWRFSVTYERYRIQDGVGEFAGPETRQTVEFEVSEADLTANPQLAAAAIALKTFCYQQGVAQGIL